MRPSLAANYSGWETSLQGLVEKVNELKPDGLLGDLQEIQLSDAFCHYPGCFFQLCLIAMLSNLS